MQVDTLDIRLGTAADTVEFFSKALRAAAIWLERNKERINALNVFPVPDGDTGDNMVLTMRGALKALEAARPGSLAEMCDLVAEGTLNGSRGNSGVILSQMVAGWAQELRQASEITPTTLAAAFRRGAEEGFKAHSQPVEGTMMTVARDLAREATLRAEEGLPMQEFLAAVVNAARESVARTTGLLPRLQQAGVVDAGGEGLAVIIEGVMRFLRGESMEDDIATTDSADFESLDMSEEDIFGYCTNFVLRGQGLDVDAFRETVLSMGQSALVVGNASYIKVHVHTEQPGEILSRALSLGTLHQLKLDNMDDQYQDVLKTKAAERATERVATALVAVAAGDGFVRIFETDARARVVPGGQSMNPSTGDLLAAIKDSPSDAVILIPNNPNVIMAARKAAEGSDKRVEVLPTRSAATGVVAALAYSPEASIEQNLEEMEAAIAGVVSIEITQAVRDAEIDGVKVRRGEYIGLVDDGLVSAHEDLAELVAATLEQAESVSKELLTLYSGQDATPDQIDAVSELVSSRWPSLQVDVQHGGQPHYVFVASLE